MSNRVKKNSIFIFALCIFLAISACAVNAASIELSKKSVTLYRSEKLTLKATVVGNNKKITWKSSKPSVASVNSKGKVTAKKTGTATITAEANGKNASCKVTVKKPSIKLNKSKATIYISGNTTLQLKATVKGSSKKVAWISSNEKIAKVSSVGKITAIKTGTITITAKANGITAKCKVTIKNHEASNSDSTSINKAYSNYYNSHLISEKDYPYGRYTLHDIDGNGIPEMFFSYMHGVRSGYKIYTYNNNKIVLLKSEVSVSCVYYNKQKKQICILTSGGSANNCYTYYRLSGGKLSAINSYRSVLQGFSDLQHISIKCYKNNKEITKSEYIKHTNVDNWGTIR